MAGKKSFVSKKTMDGIKSKVFVIALLIIFFAIGFLVGRNFIKTPQLPGTPLATEDKELTISVLEKTLENAGDLVTQKYVYRDAVYDNNAKKFFKTNINIPFTKKRVIFTYKGTISAGYNVSDIQFEVDNDAKVVTIILPEMKVIANEVDEKSFKYILEENSLFNSYKLKDFSDMQSAMKDEMQKAAKKDKIFQQNTRENAENILTDFFKGSGVVEGYDIVFK